VIVAAAQEVLEDLETGRVVVDGEHAHADRELVPPAAAVPAQPLLHRHLPSLLSDESNRIT
jgi:hypothetical protein